MAQRHSARRTTGLRHSPAAYTVRVSSRAKHVHLKLSWQGELEVVVPRGYSRRHIPKIIAAKSAWLERARARMHQQLSALPCEFFEQRPARAHLQALSRIYQVHYEPVSGTRITIDEGGHALRVRGPVEDAVACAQALRAWLRSTARRTLTPWLQETSEDLNLPYAKVTIRNQQSRWGSCSARGVISLSCKLLFLPPAQVHYLFVHELCHTKHLNHSARYWALVRRKLPDYGRHEIGLRDAWACVPRWADD